VLAALWGSSYMFIKIALDDGVRAPSIVFARLALGALVLTPLALRRGAFAGLGRRRGWVLAVALAQLALPFLLITWGEHWVPSALAGVLVASVPIFVALLNPWLDRTDIVRGWGIAGIAIGILGVVLLFGVDLSHEGRLALGGGMILLASLLYAFGSIWARTRLTGAMPIGIAASTLLVASAVTLPLAIAGPPEHVPNAGTLAALLALGAGGTGIAFLLYYILIEDLGTARASVVAYLAPGFAVLYGALFLDERIGPATIGGLALILLGSWIAAEGRLPGRPRPAGAPGAYAELAGDPMAEDALLEHRGRR
jgi:drug/metabolite transporter (DMT)-like permease